MDVLHEAQVEFLKCSRCFNQLFEVATMAGIVADRLEDNMVEPRDDLLIPMDTRNPLEPKCEEPDLQVRNKSLGPPKVTIGGDVKELTRVQLMYKFNPAIAS